MALTKIGKEGITGISNSANANAITIDSGENISLSGTLGVTGVVTANAGVVVDNITIDGTEIDLSSGTLTIDVAGGIILDADGGEVQLHDGGTEFVQFTKNSNDVRMTAGVQDGDIVFRGNDGGSMITALTLDMSAAGTAIFNAGANFNNHITLADNNTIFVGTGNDLQIYHDGSNSYIDDAGTGRLYLRGNDRVQIQKYTGEDMVTAIADGAVNLYYDNAKKFETTSAGITVTGELRSTTATINSQISIYTDGSGAEIDNTSGNFTIDTADDIILDADGGDIHFKDGGIAHGNFLLSGSNFTIGSSQNNGDLIFRGIDGGADITALTLDMSEAGDATFNRNVHATNRFTMGTTNTSTGKTGLRVKRVVYNWFSYGANASDSSHIYLHIKTDLANIVGSNPQPTMSMFHIKGYSYAQDVTDSMIGFHNWTGQYYQTAYRNNGSKTAVSSSYPPYRSSDNKVVLVINVGSSYPGISIDYHQHFEYGYQDVSVTAYSRSASVNGVY